MTRKTNVGLVEWAYQFLGQSYWYGTCVYDCSKSLLSRKSKQYPTHYKENRLKQYNADIAAKKKCADCIGLIKGYYWTRDDGTMKYGLDGRPDKGANSMFKAAKVKGAISDMPEIPGLLLYSPGHAGVYVGDGWAIEARGFAYGIVKTRVSERKWESWYQCPYIDYVDEGFELLPNEEIRDTGEPAEPQFGTRLLKYTKGDTMLVGDDVRNVQLRLAELGYSPGKIDGVFGSHTTVAVMLFQRDNGLSMDGIVGPKTRLKLQ